MTEPSPEDSSAIGGPTPKPHAAEVMLYKGLHLDRFQAEAIAQIERGHSVIVAAPTGAGKTLIAEFAIERALQLGRRLIYTAPVKALSNQKFRDFTRDYGERVGIMTGDVVLNGGGQVLIMTTEIFRNTLFDDPARLDDVDYVIFDEVHFMDDAERGTVWEESIIFAPPHVRFLCLSATIPNLHHFARWIEKIRGSRVAIVEERSRPVPLQHALVIQNIGLGTLADLRRIEAESRKSSHGLRPDWRETLGLRDREGIGAAGEKRWRSRLLDELQERGRLPCLWFLFNRRECREHALASRGRNLLDPGARKQVAALLDELTARYGLGADSGIGELRDLALHGVAFHHAGMLPTLKEIVERLFTSGLIRLLFATETFAMGVNMPARTVVFDTLHKFDGVRRSFLKTREYQQMAGRAGRRGMDEVGYVYANVEWPAATPAIVDRVLNGETEPVRSQFNLSYATLLNLYARLGKEIYRACEKSYANFQDAPVDVRRPGAAHGRGGDRWEGERKRREELYRQPGGYGDIVEQVRKRLAVLRELDYLDGDGLSEKGEFAARIYGYEIPCAEFLWSGLFEGCGEDHINVLLSSIVFESKKGDWYRRPSGEVLPGSRKRAYQAIDAVIARERAAGVRTVTRPLDFKLASAVWAWSRGEEFGALGKHTSASDGDVVRTFRLIIQLGRQLARALGSQDRLARRIERALDRINRDEVDAARQLRLDEEAMQAEARARSAGAGEAPVPEPPRSEPVPESDAEVGDRYEY